MAVVDEPFDPVTGARRLDVGARCVARIAAAEAWVSTGVFVESDESYKLTAKGTWRDKTIECGPDGYPSPTRWMRWFEWSRRMRRSKWFALIGSVDRDALFEIGLSATLKTTTRGVLVCFTNDTPGFYGNNSGFVTLTIERVQ
jgi:hypothetical protein